MKKGKTLWIKCVGAVMVAGCLGLVACAESKTEKDNVNEGSSESSCYWEEDWSWDTMTPEDYKKYVDLNLCFDLNSEEMLVANDTSICQIMCTPIDDAGGKGFDLDVAGEELVVNRFDGKSEKEREHLTLVKKSQEGDHYVFDFAESGKEGDGVRFRLERDYSNKTFSNLRVTEFEKGGEERKYKYFVRYFYRENFVDRPDKGGHQAYLEWRAYLYRLRGQLLEDPDVIDIPADRVADTLRMTVATAEDGNLRSYSCDKRNGGTESDSYIMLQYKVNGKAVTYPYSLDYLLGYYHGGFSGIGYYIYDIHSVEREDEGPLYLISESCAASSNDKTEQLTGLAFKDGEWRKEPFIAVPEYYCNQYIEEKSSLRMAFQFVETYDECASREHGFDRFVYDSKEGALYINLLDEECNPTPDYDVYKMGWGLFRKEKGQVKRFPKLATPKRF